MNYRLFASLLLMAVLAGLYLWWVHPDESAVTSGAPASAPAPASPVRIY